jgi:Uma2 family endonuclease
MAIKALFTAEDLERIQEATSKDYELVRGELYEVLPPTERHGEVSGQIYRLIANWNDMAHAGRVAVESGFTLARGPDTVRGPDVSFVARGRISREQARRGFPDLAPDLVVEVCSPSQSWADLRDKAREYLRAGSRLVLLVEADEFAEAWRAGQEPLRLELADEFRAEDVLPGFVCRVRDFFPPED